MYQRRCVYQHADDAGVIGVELSKDLVSVASRAMTHNMTKLGGQGRGGRRGGGGRGAVQGPGVGAQLCHDAQHDEARGAGQGRKKGRDMGCPGAGRLPDGGLLKT